ncbi:hypothetical protein BDN67DRAFT_1072101 [Paxillus ammoniavirescens]|nr:hypothetical protein BDN67DRAFT_1072101 [Paxillus ammoniavirescens]
MVSVQLGRFDALSRMEPFLWKFPGYSTHGPCLVRPCHPLETYKWPGCEVEARPELQSSTSFNTKNSASYHTHPSCLLACLVQVLLPTFLAPTTTSQEARLTAPTTPRQLAMSPAM